MRDTARKSTAEHALGVVRSVMGNGAEVSTNVGSSASVPEQVSEKKKGQLPCIPLSRRCQVSHGNELGRSKGLVYGGDLT